MHETRDAASPAAPRTATPDVPLPYLYLSQPGIGSADETLSYYASLGAEFDLETWLEPRCLSGPDVVRATWFNERDLGLGRAMACARCGRKTSCVVTNYGAPGGAEADAREAFAAGRSGLTVAMEHDPDRGEAAVQFFAFGADGLLANAVTLDDEGEKFAPRVCLTCHGGRLDAATGRVLGASFVDLDETLPPLDGALDPGTSREDVRALNDVIVTTRPAPAVVERILEHRVRPGAFIPDGWHAAPQLYSRLIGPYCAICHDVLQPRLRFDSAEAFEAFRGTARTLVCDADGRRAALRAPPMPQAVVPNARLHADVAALDLLCGPAGAP